MNGLSFLEALKPPVPQPIPPAIEEIVARHGVKIEMHDERAALILTKTRLTTFDATLVSARPRTPEEPRHELAERVFDLDGIVAVTIQKHAIGIDISRAFTMEEVLPRVLEELQVWKMSNNVG